jgi:hypothetical protein
MNVETEHLVDSGVEWTIDWYIDNFDINNCTERYNVKRTSL